MMSCIKYFLTLAVLLAIVASLPMWAQVEKTRTWQEDLNYLAQASTNTAEVRVMLGNIRFEVESWLKLHPDSKVTLPPAMAASPSDAQLREQVKLLQATVGAIIQHDPNRPFHLGSADVNVTASISELSPIADSIDSTEMIKRNDLNVASAVELLPGVNLTQQYSGRNQVMVQIHGFNYLQVPLFIDGIPVSDPYDGTLDFRLIPTGDIAEVQVAKGFSSPLLGPNAVGGAINIVTKEPQKKFEGDFHMGGFSGYGMTSGGRVGTRQKLFFAQLGMDWVQQEFVPLSNNFVRTPNAQPNLHLNNSDMQSARYSGKLGITPRGTDEYVLSISRRKPTLVRPVAASREESATRPNWFLASRRADSKSSTRPHGR